MSRQPSKSRRSRTGGSAVSDQYRYRTENKSNSHNGVHQSKRLLRSGKSSNTIDERKEKDRVECSDKIDCDFKII